MGGILSAILDWFFKPAAQRVMWAGGSLWFALGIIPLVAGKIFDLVGNPFSLITPEMWWAIDLFGLDIWYQFLVAAYSVRFTLRRLPK
jgi:hypothetical protein